MQIQSTNPQVVYKTIGDYVDRGWHQVSLGAKSRYTKTIVDRINNSIPFKNILESDQVGINAMNFSDGNEFIITLVFNPSRKQTIELVKSMLYELKNMRVFYGKQLLSKHVLSVNSLVDDELEAIIDSFWGKRKRKLLKIASAKESEEKKPEQKKTKRVIIFSIITVVLFAVVFYLLLVNNSFVVSKISNQLLLDIAYSHSDNPAVKAASVRNMEDENILRDIAVDSDSEEIIKEAVNNVQDRGVLIDMYVNSAGCRSVIDSMPEKYIDEQFYIDAAGESDEVQFLLDVLSHINDQDVLSKYIDNAYHEWVRKKVAGRITRESLLIDIVKNDESKYVKEIAAKNIKNERELIDLIENHTKDNNVQLALLDNVEDPEYLYNAAMGVSRDFSRDHLGVRAVSRIERQDKLFELAKNSIYYSVKRSAVKRITDKRQLISIAHSTDDREVLRTAVEKISDEQDLAEIAIAQNSGLAISKVDSEDVLERIVYSAKSRHTVSTALKRINSPSRIREIARRHTWYWAAEQAERRLNQILNSQ